MCPRLLSWPQHCRRKWRWKRPSRAPSRQRTERWSRSWQPESPMGTLPNSMARQVGHQRSTNHYSLWSLTSKRVKKPLSQIQKVIDKRMKEHFPPHKLLNSVPTRCRNVEENLERAWYSKVNRGCSGVFITIRTWPTTEYTVGLYWIHRECCLGRPSPRHFISTHACLHQLWKIVVLFGVKLPG